MSFFDSAFFNPLFFDAAEVVKDPLPVPIKNKGWLISAPPTYGFSQSSAEYGISLIPAAQYGFTLLPPPSKGLSLSPAAAFGVSLIPATQYGLTLLPPPTYGIVLEAPPNYGVEES